MPRPVSWLPRLHEIRRTVGASVRSCYDRRDLEALFQLQPRAAQKLLEVLPAISVGTSRLVERDVLVDFLNKVQEADNMPTVLEQMRHQKARSTRKRVHSLVRRDTEKVSLDSLPDCISLARGRLEVRFQSVEQLAQAMYFLARLLESDGDDFHHEFAPQNQAMPSADAEEIRAMFSDLKRRELDRKSIQ